MSELLASLILIVLAIVFLPVHIAGYLWDLTVNAFNAGRERAEDHVESLILTSRGW